MDSLTTDTFFNGRIKVKQHRSGYRFSIDAVLIAGLAKPDPADTVIDLGTGCGIIPIMLAYRFSRLRVYGIEIQPELCELAGLNVKENDMEDRITILNMDMKALQPANISKTVDVIVTNPPFRRAETGRINPNRQRAIARHEIKITLADIVDTARRMLRLAGRFAMIYPAERTTDVLSHMRGAGVEPKLIRMIHSGRHTGAKLIHVEGIKGGRPGVKIGPPLIIYDQDGVYTEEVQKMFTP